MKKLISVLLCLLFTVLALAGCGDVDRSEWLGTGKDDDGKVIGGKYDGQGTVSTIHEANLNLYIVVEDETWNGEGVAPAEPTSKIGVGTQAINTVNNAIKDYTSTNYHTAVNVIYVKASEYNTVVLEAVKAENSDAKAANIVLINSYSLMQDLAEYLCPLDSYLATTKYGRLNKTIPSSLLQASRIEVAANGTGSSALYSIPNNHVIGNYEYLLVNKNLARELNINETSALALNSYVTAVDVIEAAINASGMNVSVEDVISLVSGSYEDRFSYEKFGYYCNVVKNPVADKNEAFLSAFAIVKREHDKVDINERAMEIIYNINTNSELRNLLQYGVAGTNYNIDEDESIKMLDGSNSYKMNLVYTGDIMLAHHCEEIGWTEEAQKNASSQNADSITVEQLTAMNNKNNQATSNE